MMRLINIIFLILILTISLFSQEIIETNCDISFSGHLINTTKKYFVFNPEGYQNPVFIPKFIVTRIILPSKRIYYQDGKVVLKKRHYINSKEYKKLLRKANNKETKLVKSFQEKNPADSLLSD